jgi:hypothetical protein
MLNESVRRVRHPQRIRIIFGRLQCMTTRHMHTKLQMNRFMFDGDIKILKFQRGILMLNESVRNVRIPLRMRIIFGTL